MKKHLDYKNTPIGDVQTKRLLAVKDFIDFYSQEILVYGIGEFERMLIQLIRDPFQPVPICVQVAGDYNYKAEFIPSNRKFRTIFCFEVLEHICNPLLFLEEMKNNLTEHGVIYLSTPAWRPRFLWTNGHFYEYDKDRLEHLFDMAGLAIVKRGSTGILFYKKIKKYIGIRPILRLFFPLRCRLYKLKRKVKDA